jgi:hypothetical protein
MAPPVTTKDAAAVAAFCAAIFQRLYPGVRWAWLDRIFRDIEILFSGAHPEYAAVDARYHDLEHTMQAAACIALIFEGRAAAGVEPRLDARQFELALSAALLHDTGYLKLRSDTCGTGAKYTFCHVVRSCAFAASYLPTLGANDLEIEAVMAAINCTGPTTEMSRLRFRHPIEHTIGCALATADFLGQMAAPDYADELEILFEEFHESDEFIHLPAERRVFKSARELIERTPAFWESFVLPKLKTDFQGVYRYLSRPWPDGPNAYLEAVEENIRTVKRRIAGFAAAPTLAANPR